MRALKPPPPFLAHFFLMAAAFLLMMSVASSLHEFAHALTAKVLGLDTTGIHLFKFNRIVGAHDGRALGFDWYFDVPTGSNPHAPIPGLEDPNVSLHRKIPILFAGPYSVLVLGGICGFVTVRKWYELANWKYLRGVFLSFSVLTCGAAINDLVPWNGERMMHGVMHYKDSVSIISGIELIGGTIGSLWGAILLAAILLPTGLAVKLCWGNLRSIWQSWHSLPGFLRFRVRVAPVNAIIERYRTYRNRQHHS